MRSLEDVEIALTSGLDLQTRGPQACRELANQDTFGVGEVFSGSKSKAPPLTCGRSAGHRQIDV